MIFSKSLFCVLITGVIPKAIASRINLQNGLLPRHDKTPILVPFDEEFGYPRVNITLGSQKSLLKVGWDTGGEGQLWVPNSNVTCLTCIGNNTGCLPDATGCKAQGTFNPLNSTTFVDLHQNWSIKYSFGDADLGWLGTDQLGIGGSNGEAVTIPDLKLAVAYFAYDRPFLGMGMYLNSSPEYLPTKLKKQGSINKAAFSYWHDSSLSTTRSFLLGGVDEAKHEGDLVAVHVTLSNDSTVIPMTAIVVDGEAIPLNESAVVDTGSPYLFLPPPLLAKVVTKLGGSLDSWDGDFFSIPCNQGNKTVDFVFENATIVAPISAFLDVPLNGSCDLLIGREKELIIGVSVQKYAYWVFDQDDHTVSIGKPTYSTDSRIVKLEE